MVKPFYSDSAVTLYHGDCREVLPELDAVDHVITDPPYAKDVYVRLSLPNTKAGSGTPARLTVPLKGKQGRQIHDLKDGALAKMAAGDIGAIDDILEEVAGHIARITQRWAIVFSDAETTDRWRVALRRRGPITDGCFEWEGMRYVRTGAWVKPNAMPQMSGDRPAVGFEPATICHAQGPMRWNGGGHQAVWTHGTCSGNERPNHPCPKPEALMRDLVLQFTDPGELVLDPFAGSGTTLFACKRLGRRAIGIEIDEAFAEVAAQRLQQSALDLWESAPTVGAAVPRTVNGPRATDLFSDEP